MLNLMRRILFIFLLLASIMVCKAQDKDSQINDQYWGIPAQPFNCETNDSYLAQVANIMKTQNNQKGVLIIIARVGTGEKQHKKLNYRRLYNVRVKLNKEFGVLEDMILPAESEQIRGFGRIEFYLAGEMVGALLAGKNQDLCVSCCGLDERFYPDKAKSKRKQVINKFATKYFASLLRKN